MKACIKKRFSKKGAEKAIDNALWSRLAGNFKRLENRAYFCNECKAYHITKT